MGKRRSGDGDTVAIEVEMEMEMEMEMGTEMEMGMEMGMGMGVMMQFCTRHRDKRILIVRVFTATPRYKCRAATTLLFVLCRSH